MSTVNSHHCLLCYCVLGTGGVWRIWTQPKLFGYVILNKLLNLSYSILVFKIWVIMRTK